MAYGHDTLLKRGKPRGAALPPQPETDITWGA